MKKVILALAAGITITLLGSLLFLYKIGEDISEMSRCGCRYK